MNKSRCEITACPKLAIGEYPDDDEGTIALCAEHVERYEQALAVAEPGERPLADLVGARAPSKPRTVS